MKNTTLFFLFLLTVLCNTNVFSQSIEKEAIENSASIENLSIYPNPVSGTKLFVVTKDNFTKKVSIFNVLGKEILSETVSGKELNISKLKAGIYIIKIQENNTSATRKLIVK